MNSTSGPTAPLSWMFAVVVSAGCRVAGSICTGMKAGAGTSTTSPHAFTILARSRRGDPIAQHVGIDAALPRNLGQRQAITRHPALRQYRLSDVADAMVRAKAHCLEQGLDLKSEGSAEAIQLAALALLQAGR